MELAFSPCFELFSTVVFPGTVFVTLFPTTVETVHVDAATTIPTFYRFAGQVLIGHRYLEPPLPPPLPPVRNQTDEVAVDLKQNVSLSVPKSVHKTVSRVEKGSSVVELDFLCSRLFSTVVF